MNAIVTTAGGHKLGKLHPKPVPLRHRMAAAQFMATLPAAPETRDWMAPVAVPSGLMRNGDLSDCVEAAIGHFIQTTSANNGSEVTPSDDDVVKVYSGAAGYVVGDPSTDQGSVEADVLVYMKATGMAGIKIDGFAPCNSTNLGEIRQVTNTFGGCLLGLALPKTIETQGETDGSTWSVDLSAGADAEPGSLGGHGVVVEKYDANGLWIWTWGIRVYLTNDFMVAYGSPAVGGEAWALLANGLWAPKGVTPAGDAVPAYDGFLAAVS